MMNDRPKMVNILFFSFVITGFLFVGMFISQLFQYYNYQNMGSLFSVSSQMTYSTIMYLILYLVVSFFSFFCAYRTIKPKAESWVFGLILSSFFLWFFFMGVYFIGVIIINNVSFDFDNFEYYFQYIVFILMIFFVPLNLYILTREDTKKYYKEK